MLEASAQESFNLASSRASEMDSKKGGAMELFLVSELSCAFGYFKMKTSVLLPTNYLVRF